MYMFFLCMVEVKKQKKPIKNNPNNQDSRNQGFRLCEMIELIEKESHAPDISDYDRRRLIFLHGFLYNIAPPEEERNTNIASAVEICRRIKLKYAKPLSDKFN